MIGLIGKKIGMTQLFDEIGEPTPVTVVYAEPNIVVRKKTKESDGYEACVIGTGVKKKPNRPYSGVFLSKGESAHEIKPTKVLQEIRDAPADWKCGMRLTVGMFTQISKVDVTGYSKGRGFAGVMKRYGWHGGAAAHGSKFHRRAGSVGTSKNPGHIVKGHRLPGRMGNCKVTVKNLKVMRVEELKHLLFLKGAIPGSLNSWVLIKCKPTEKSRQ